MAVKIRFGLIGFCLFMMLSSGLPAKEAVQENTQKASVVPLSIDTEKALLSFTAQTTFVDVSGRFDFWTGTIFYNPRNPLSSSVEININAKSINTTNRTRDKHLRGEDFFHVEKYPEIIFKSKMLKPMEAQPEQYMVFGELTLHGITKSIEFPVRIQEKDGVIQAKARFTIKRRDFGLRYRSFLNPIKDDVEVQFEVASKAPSA